MVGAERAAVWGEPDLSANPFATVWTQLSGLYLYNPVVSGIGARTTEEVRAYWPFMQRVQRDALALRECGVFVERAVTGLRFRSIQPGLLTAEVDSIGDVAAITEHLATGAAVRYDLASVRSYDKDGNLTAESGPLTDAFGAAYIPIILYHAAQTGAVWDPYSGIEILEGSLNLSVYYSLFGHALRNAAWAQRYIIGGEPMNQSMSDGRSKITGDAAAILLFRLAEDGTGQATAGQWSAPHSPNELIDAIAKYEQRILGMALGTAEVARSTSDIRSGYSLAVSREARREAQYAYAPVFAASDREALRLFGRLLGESNESAEVRHVLASPAERRAELLDLLARQVLEVSEVREALTLP
jgi:hypothetical protein